MPFYEYRCPECDNTMMLKKRISDRNDPVKCDNKGAHPKKKVFMVRGRDTAGFALKGGGWAKDGYSG